VTFIRPLFQRMTLLMLLTIAVFAFAACAAATPEPTPMVEGITAVNPPVVPNDFTLVNQSGEDVNLADLNGKLTLLFFGYTHCPDFCPNTLDEFKRIRTLLGDRASDVQFVFVTVDGTRDTVERMADYLRVRAVDDFVIGLTGSEADVQAAGQPFGLFFERNGTTTTAAAYLVDHTTQSYLLDRSGQVRVIYSYTVGPEAIAENIRQYL
jgi:protein SCO1/2